MNKENVININKFASCGICSTFMEISFTRGRYVCIGFSHML